jgi:hypothetical protein
VVRNVLDMLTYKPQLEFPRESGIFYHHVEGEAFLTQKPNEFPVPRYSWILQLLQHKTMYLPNLVKVQMTDPPGRIGYYYWETAKWVLPQEVWELCDEEGVEMDVHFSFPQPGSNLDMWNERKCRPRHKLASHHYTYY